MVVFGKKLLSSVKKSCIRTKWMYSSNSGFTRAKLVVFRQSGLILAKLLYSGKSGSIRVKWFVLGDK